MSPTQCDKDIAEIVDKTEETRISPVKGDESAAEISGARTPTGMKRTISATESDTDADVEDSELPDLIPVDSQTNVFARRPMSDQQRPIKIPRKCVVIDTDSPSTKSLKNCLPLPWESTLRRVSAVDLIVYEELMGQIKLNDFVEVIGVFVPASKQETTRWISTEIPALHILAVRPATAWHPMINAKTDLSLGKAAVESLIVQDLDATRDSLVEYLARPLGGDILAAKYLLLTITARLFHRLPDETPLGVIPLNLYGLPAHAITADVSAVGRSLTRALESICPRVAALPFTLSMLTEKRWRPFSDPDAEKIHAGMLQLAPGTVLVVDETGMKEGNLNEAAYSEFAAVEHLVKQQMLKVNFAFYDRDYKAEVPAIVLSHSKSLLNMQLTLKVTPKDDQTLGASADDAKFEKATDDLLDRYRKLIGWLQSMREALDSTPEFNQQFGDGFIAARKVDTKLDPNVLFLH